MDKPDLRKVDKGPTARETPNYTWRWRVLAVWVIAFTVGIFYLFNDIQTGRLKSCKATYNSIEDVALSFLPPPSKRTPRQEFVANNLHQFILGRIAHCKKQIN